MAKVAKKGKPKGKVKKKSNPLKMHSAAGRAELARLRNIQRDNYGAEGDQAYLVKLAKKVGRGVRPSGSQDWKVRAGKATRDKQALRAGRTVQAELNPQIGAAKNYEAGLQKLYEATAASQAQNAGQMAQRNTASRAAIGGNYDQLASSIANEFTQSRQSANDELSRLGIQMGDASGSGAVEARLASLAESGRANALSQQDASGQGYNQLMSLLQGETAATGASLRGASSQKRGQLEASRPGKVYSLWQQLEDQQRAESREQQQQNFLNRITKARFGVESDYKNAQALAALGSARKSIVDSKRPTVVKRTRKKPAKYQ